MHYHAGKVNWFLVSLGAIEVSTAAGVHIVLGPGMAYCVQPWVPHRMRFLTDAAGHEFYVATESNLDLADIVRLEPGWTPEGQEWKA